MLGRYFNDEVAEEKEYTDKKVSAVSEKTNTKISVSYNEGYNNNCAYKNKNGYVIEINGAIPVRVAIDHELSHCKEGSLEDSYWKPAKAIIQKWTMDNNYHNSYDKEEMINNICHSALNIIEDIRIESIDGKTFAGRAVGYRCTCSNEGKRWSMEKYEPDSIAGYVLAKRFFRDDLIPDTHKKEVEKIFKQSELNSVEGIHKVFYDWIHGSLGEYIKKMVKDIEDTHNEISNMGINADSIREQKNKILDMLEELRNNINHSTDTDEKEKLEDEAYKTEREYNKLRDELNSIEKEIRTKQNKIGNTISSKHKIKGQSITKVTTSKPTQAQIKAIDKKMSKVEINKEKEKTLKRIQDEVSISSGEQQLNPIFDELNMTQHRIIPTINTDIVNSLKKIFNTIKQRTKLSLSEDGDDIDIETMLEVIKKGSNEFYIDNKKVDGTSIVIGLDCSGSMRDDQRIETCTNISATMFKVLESIPSIDMKVVCYGGCNNKQLAERVGVYTINNTNDCNKIGIDSGYILTPTADALSYCASTLQKMKGKNKLLLFLTDGVPQNANDINVEELAKHAGMVYRQIKGIPHITIKPVIINGSDNYKHIFDIIFGKDWLPLQTKSLSEFFKNEFKRTIIRSFK